MVIVAVLASKLTSISSAPSIVLRALRTRAAQPDGQVMPPMRSKYRLDARGAVAASSLDAAGAPSVAPAAPVTPSAAASAAPTQKETMSVLIGQAWHRALATANPSDRSAVAMANTIRGWLPRTPVGPLAKGHRVRFTGRRF
jgi:hypothetical protein